LPSPTGGERSDVTGDPRLCCFAVSFGEFDGSLPVNDFRFPRTGFGPEPSDDCWWSLGEVSVIDGLTMRGRGLLELLLGVDVAGTAADVSILNRLVSRTSQLCCLQQNHNKQHL